MASPVCPWWVGKTRDQLIEEVGRLRTALSASKMIDEDQNKRIERLRERIEKFKGMLNTPVQCPQCDLHLGSFRQTAMTNHIITSNQIRRVWGILSGWNEDYADRVIAAAVRSTLEAAFKELGIVRCGGVGRNGWRCIGEKCPACHGKGWIIASDAICSKRSTNND